MTSDLTDLYVEPHTTGHIRKTISVTIEMANSLITHKTR